MSTTPDRAALSGNPTISIAPNDSSGERYLTDQFSKVPFGVVSHFPKKNPNFAATDVCQSIAQAKYLHLRKGIHITFKDFLLVVPQMAVKGRQSAIIARFK